MPPRNPKNIDKKLFQYALDSMNFQRCTVELGVGAPREHESGQKLFCIGQYTLARKFNTPRLPRGEMRIGTYVWKAYVNSLDI